MSRAMPIASSGVAWLACMIDARLVGADADDREIERARALSDLAEHGARRGVAAEPDLACGRSEREAAPQGAIAIERAAAGEMHGGEAG